MTKRKVAEVLPVGPAEIADALDVDVRTVYQWQNRGVFLAPRWTVGGRPAWNMADVLVWAHETGRA
jgi:phage terminase Nu1 subunit (DNA packaging protein)